MSDERGERRDFRQDVTNKIIEMLERGTAPWQKPWDPEKATLEMPMNPTTGQPYRGGNALHLLAEGVSKGYEDPRWLTYRQANENGWQVRKGEKGTRIEFWQFPSRDKESGGKEVADSAGTVVRGDAPLHRVYTVFNAQQIEGMPERQAEVRPEWKVVESAENILAGSGARILHDQQDRAYYSRGADEIHLPTKTAFPNEAAYYGTALHELGHWTGHESRLNRETLVNSSGVRGPEYAKEELRAELTSLFLAAERGIPHDPEQHAAYVGSWIEVLQKDKNEIFRAAKDASKATEYLLEREKEREAPERTGEREIVNERRVEIGQHLDASGIAVPDVVRSETSEHAATFDTRTGAVEFVEKNTAVETRELYQPVAHGEPDALASARTSEEQILDGVVDGRPAPGVEGRASSAAASRGPGQPSLYAADGPPKAALAKALGSPLHTQGSLENARSLVRQTLGDDARSYDAHTDSGQYKGPIIGTTAEHLIQQITGKAAVIHEASGPLAGIVANPNQSLSISYNNHLAMVQQMQPKAHTRELAELER